MSIMWTHVLTHKEKWVITAQESGWSFWVVFASKNEVILLLCCSSKSGESESRTGSGVRWPLLTWTTGASKHKISTLFIAFSTVALGYHFTGKPFHDLKTNTYICERTMTFLYITMVFWIIAIIIEEQCTVLEMN